MDETDCRSSAICDFIINLINYSLPDIMLTFKDGSKTSSNLSYAFKNGVLVRIKPMANKAYSNASVQESISQNQLPVLK